MKRQIGSVCRGLSPAIIRRGKSRLVTASEITPGSKTPNDTRHFCASGRIGLSSSSYSNEMSRGSTRKRSLAGVGSAGAQISDNRLIVCSAEHEISERHSESKYLIR